MVFTGCSRQAAKKVLLDEKSTQAEASERKGHRDPQAGLVDRREHWVNTGAFNFYVNGILAEEHGDLPKALEYYQRAQVHFSDSYEIGMSIAKIHLRMRNPELALESLKDVSPRDQEVYRLSAACFHALGDNDAYRGAYRNILRIDPRDAESYSRLGHAYITSRDYDSATWAYESLAGIEAYNYRVWAQLGRLYIQKQEYQKALEAYRHSVDVNSSIDNLLSIVSLGELYDNFQQIDSALVVFDRALEVDPTNSNVLNRVVTRLTQQNRYSEALPYALRLEAVMPDDIAQSRRLGMIYFFEDSLASADSVFTSIVDRGDRFDLNHYFLGQIAMAQREFEKARDQFLIQTSMVDTIAFTWISLGTAYRELGQVDEEIGSYTTGLDRMVSQDARIGLLFSLATAYERNSKFDSAVTTFEDILSLDEDFHPALNFLGYMLADSGRQLDYALELISRAVELEPTNAAYLDSYGWVFYRLGDFDKALEYLQQAVELDSDPVMFDHLGDAFEAKGEMDLARHWWRKALETEPDNVAIMEKLNR